MVVCVNTHVGRAVSGGGETESETESRSEKNASPWGVSEWNESERPLPIEMLIQTTT